MLKTALADIDLHDGQILRTTFDHESRSITIEIAYYAAMEERSRRFATLRFGEVDMFSCMADALSISGNASPGNIADWLPSEGRGTTFIYLVGGTLAIMAANVSFQEHR